MIRLEEINEENWRIPLGVSKAQERFVANTTTILARAYAYRNAGSQALLICEDETPVGMALYHDADSLGAYIFSEILVDERFQGRGYGTTATRLILDRMKQEGKYHKVVLCYIEGNDAARKLYESFGFAETDRDEDEIIMELNLGEELL